MSSAHALLKSAKAGTSKSTEDGISGLKVVVSLVTLVCVSTATVSPEVTERKKMLKLLNKRTMINVYFSNRIYAVERVTQN